MELMLIRHGEPDYANDALTQTGHAQAKLLAAALAAERIDELFASPMGRAQLTARYTADAKQLPITTLDWLHELDGNHRDNLWAWNQSGSETFLGETPIRIDNWHRCVGYGPHMQRVVAPFHAAFDAFLAHRGAVRQGQRYRVPHATGRTLAFFCHAGVILTLLAHLLHVPLPVAYAQFACEPSSRTTLRFEHEGGFGVFRLLSLNDLSHLRGLDAGSPVRAT